MISHLIFISIGLLSYLGLLCYRSRSEQIAQNPDYYFDFRHATLKQCIEQSESIAKLQLLRMQIDELYNDFAGRITFKKLDNGCDELRELFNIKEHSLKQKLIIND